MTNNLDKFVKDEISQRSSNGQLLAKKFPELKGLSYQEFLLKLPINVDFITGCEMYDALNKN
jgi:hypothetical protein